MKEHVRGFVIGCIVLALVLPTLYVGTEGVWYLATGKSHFEAGSTYRTVYAPLDEFGNHWPEVYEGRQRLANCWIRLSGDRSGSVHVAPNLLPSPYYTIDGYDILIYPPDEFQLSREAAARTRLEAEGEAAALNAADAASCPVGLGDASDD